MSGEAIRRRESSQEILTRAIEQAQTSPEAPAALVKSGKKDIAEAINDIVRTVQEALSRRSDAAEERQYLRRALRDCGVGGDMADLFTQAFFEELKAAQPKDTSFRGKMKALGREFVDVFKNTGGTD